MQTVSTIPTGFWQKPCREVQYSLTPGEVHVWLASLKMPAAQMTELRACLSFDEVAKASRFRSRADQTFAMVSRGILRHLLGNYLQMAPEDIPFACNAYGKPGLARPTGDGLNFNLSHSHPWVVVGFAWGRRIGVDVERIRPESANDELVGHYLAPAEACHLRSLPVPDRVHAFFECWTRKEAFLKARGDGLMGRLDSFEVAFGRDSLPAILRVAENETPAGDWSVVNLPLGDSYAGAVVVDGPCHRLKCFQWSLAVSGEALETLPAEMPNPSLAC